MIGKDRGIGNDLPILGCRAKQMASHAVEVGNYEHTPGCNGVCSSALKVGIKYTKYNVELGLTAMPRGT